MIEGRWHPSLPRFLCWKSSHKELSLSLSSVNFGCRFKINFLSLALELFCRWIENCFCRLSLPRSELFCFFVNLKLFLPGFLSLIASVQATGVVLSLFQYSQLVLFPMIAMLFQWLFGRCASIQNLFLSPRERYSPRYLSVMYSKFKIIFLSQVVPLQAISKLFLSLVPFTVNHFDTVPPFNIFLMLITSLRSSELLFCWVTF